MAIPIGIKYPVALGKSGYFDQTFTTLDEARGNIIHLVLTNRGERLMQPEFGTDIYKLLFENITADIPSVVKQNVKTSVQNWLPYVILKSVEVDLTKENIDRNVLPISITFSVKQDPVNFDTVNVLFSF